MDITINHVSLRAKSSLNTSSDICAICRENVCDGCIKCQQANESLQSNETGKCFSVIGVCNHTYHYCCIQSCLATQYNKKCPMCNKTWEMKKRNTANTDQKIKKIRQKNQNGRNIDHLTNHPPQNQQIIVSDSEDNDDDSDVESVN
jgi:hypothetical protein